MVCFRLDKLEAAIGRLESLSTPSQNRLERILGIMNNELKKAIDTLKHNMSSFTRELISTNYPGTTGNNGING
jgi:hypothetical protein